jgi:FeS assembly SUF system regulator
LSYFEIGMLRIAKLTDYGIILMAHFARQEPGTLLSSREVADATNFTAPTVSKLLKLLTRSDLLCSVRGANGGYQLNHPPESIDVSQIIEALEGPLAMTECADARVSTCTDESCCPLRTHWNHINLAVKTALETVTLQQIATPFPTYSFEPRAIPMEQVDV